MVYIRSLNTSDSILDAKYSHRAPPLTKALFRPEFSHLQTYDPPSVSDENETQFTASIPLKEQIMILVDPADEPTSKVLAVKKLLMEAFLTYLAPLLGFSKETLDPSHSLAMHGLDSLSGVGCQYWFWRGVCPQLTYALPLIGAEVVGELFLFYESDGLRSHSNNRSRCRCLRREDLDGGQY